MDNKLHWETVYTTKQPHEVSWTQAVPETSLQFINDLGLAKNARIIDVGGGDSRLVDFLLQEGYTDVTVLDISAHALERAKERLGPLADRVTWIACDILAFQPSGMYDVWHDRAAFHFLIDSDQVKAYTDLVEKAVGGHLVIGTFSKEGPTKCSGLEIRQYSESELGEVFGGGFDKLRCRTESHETPFGTRQEFVFCQLSKR